MAEIRVEKKNRPIWPWILGILLAIVLIWLIVENTDNDDGVDDDTYNTEDTLSSRDDAMYDSNDPMYDDTEGSQNEAQAYVAFVEENRENVTIEHEYSHQALTKLANALNSVATLSNTTVENKAELDKLRQQANKLTVNPTSTEHANIMSDAFTSAANILVNIQNKQFPDLKDEVEEVKEAAKKVRKDVIVTDQKDAVKDFFEISADAIEAMTENV